MKRLISVFSAVGLLTTGAVQAVTTSVAGAYPSDTVALVGHGYGHGRGMSQYGSLGHALAGKNHAEILNHYYSNTTMGAVGNLAIGVRLVSADGADLIVTAGSPFSVHGMSFATNQAAIVRKVAANTFDIYRSNGCAGEGGWQKINTVNGPVNAAPPADAPGDNMSLMLARCVPEGKRAYRGNITTLDNNGVQRSVNNVLLEDYLRGVVPRESPASWGDLGAGAGMNALRAQSVAARSYSIAAPAYPYATTCDTISCQVYGGAFLNGVKIEDPRTDAAIAETAGQVRKLGVGIARTEFSSSSGGYTAGGVFPAVPDPLDEAQGRNSNFRWTANVAVTTIQAKYPAIGGLNSISINSRNGLGDQGGRVTSMTLHGTSGSVTITGADFRAKLSLKSDWFQVTGSPSGGVNGYWLVGLDGGVYTFGAAAFKGSAGNIALVRPIVGMAPTPTKGGYWLVASDGGIFTYGDARFFGSTGGMRLNQPVVGMSPTASGSGYWLVASDGGIFTYGDAKFFGSTGGMRLNQPVRTMAATASGKGYWLVASDGGVFTFGDAPFLGSTGSIQLRSPIVSMARTPDGNGYWLLGADGGVFTFGSAGFFGSLPGSKVVKTAVSIAPTATGQGYLITAQDGSVFSFGDAPQFGGVPSQVPGFKGSVVGIAPVG